jgi:nickel/cobalt transporter (NicO) family protein
MSDIATLLQEGSTNAWLFVPSAILLGALHGLEPGHSKTMMAAFIVAIRGTVAQAVLLGLAATLSHTAVVWVVALTGLHFAGQWNAETSEPYFQVASAVMIIGVASWMLWRTWRHQNDWLQDHGDHEHDHAHGHHHAQGQGGDSKRIDTVRMEVFEDGVPPRFRLYDESAHRQNWSPHDVSVRTLRPNGSHQTFTFVHRDGFLESVEEIPEPHEFIARLSLGHGDHTHDYDLEYVEHGHTHAVADYAALDATSPGYQDPHELAHANDLRRRFAERHVTNGQILIFGLTGGLVPCPAAITVLLLCLQLKQFTLGVALVVCFSVGLALTLVLSGVVAALSVHHAAKHWTGLGDVARKAPYFSGAVILMIGLFVGYQGLRALL